MNQILSDVYDQFSQYFFDSFKPVFIMSYLTLCILIGWIPIILYKLSLFLIATPSNILNIYNLSLKHYDFIIEIDKEYKIFPIIQIITLWICTVIFVMFFLRKDLKAYISYKLRKFEGIFDRKRAMLLVPLCYTISFIISIITIHGSLMKLLTFDINHNCISTKNNKCLYIKNTYGTTITHQNNLFELILNLFLIILSLYGFKLKNLDIPLINLKNNMRIYKIFIFIFLAYFSINNNEYIKSYIYITNVFINITFEMIVSYSNKFDTYSFDIENCVKESILRYHDLHIDNNINTNRNIINFIFTNRERISEIIEDIKNFRLFQAEYIYDDVIELYENIIENGFENTRAIVNSLKTFLRYSNRIINEINVLFKFPYIEKYIKILKYIKLYYLLVIGTGICIFHRLNIFVIGLMMIDIYLIYNQTFYENDKMDDETNYRIIKTKILNIKSSIYFSSLFTSKCAKIFNKNDEFMNIINSPFGPYTKAYMLFEFIILNDN